MAPARVGGSFVFSTTAEKEAIRGLGRMGLLVQ
jgi:hypothetical protein